MIIRWCHGLLDLSQLLRYHELGSEDNGNTKALTNSAQKEMTAQVTSANAPSLFLGERSIPPLRGHRHESLDQWKFTCINSVLAIINYLFRARVARNDCPIYSGMKLYKLQMGRFFSVISPNTFYTYFWKICEKAVKVSIVTDFAMSLQSLSTSTHQQKINPRNKWPRLSLDCSAWISMDPPSVRIGWPPPLPQCSNKWIWIHG